MVIITDRADCKNLISKKRCKAFPDGIPDEIYYGYDFSKKKVLKPITRINCNNGYKYEPK